MSQQPPHPTLLIPGPIELDDAVTQSMAFYGESHVGASFISTFSETLTMTRRLFQTTSPDSQPFIIAGSGTLGWDMVAANILEPGDDVLVLHTGYFADSFADCLSTYGIKPTQLKAPIGSRPQPDEIEAALRAKPYKALTVTHVDTSTGVLSALPALSALLARVSPGTLLIVDAVCSVGSETLAFDAQNLDVVLTASQKAIGAPPGLSIMMCSGRAIQAFRSRSHPPTSYYASFANWIPIMQAYEARTPKYFATPPTQLVRALHTALTQLLARPLEERFARHREASAHVKTAVGELGLRQVAGKPEDQANGMTAMYLPESLVPGDVVPLLAKKGVVFAGGLHREIATKYIRFGHMGVSVMDKGRGDLDRALQALKEALGEAKKAKGMKD